MKTITEDYVSFETAKLLKEKGFNEECFALYNPDGMLIQSGIRLNNIQVGRVKGSYSTPTQQMAMRWLREKHNIDILITLGGFIEKGKVYFCSVYKNLIRYGDLKERLTYEDAVEAALKYSLENLI